MSKPRLIIISSPSGAGKTTLSKLVLKQYPDCQLSISVTTRPKRDNEIEGKDYFFLKENCVAFNNNSLEN